MKTPDVAIRFVDISLFDDVVYNDNHAYNKNFPAGTAAWIGNFERSDPNAALNFICPCGCQSVHCIGVNKGEKKDKAWLWDGNIEKPTLTPSIQCLTPCRWHGYLTGGIFRSC